MINIPYLLEKQIHEIHLPSQILPSSHSLLQERKESSKSFNQIFAKTDTFFIQ